MAPLAKSPFAPDSGFAFVGLEYLHNDIYPAIDVSKSTGLQQPGKVVLITEAGRGLGRSMAIQYARANVATIILCARTGSELNEVEERVKELNKNVRVRKDTLDVTDNAAVKDLARRVDQEVGRLDILIKNAGVVSPWESVGETNPSDYWQVLEVNLYGPLLFTHAFLPLLVKTAEAHSIHVNIINVTSIGAVTVVQGGSSYNLSKLALQKLSESIALEYGEKEVNAFGIHPGGVVTKLSNKVKELKDCKLHLKFVREDLLTSKDMTDTLELSGGFVVWLSSQERGWLNGRYAEEQNVVPLWKLTV